MQRRDRQSEVVVAVIAVGVIAVALTFGIVLSLGTPNEEPILTPSMASQANIAISDQRPTIAITIIAQNFTATSQFTETHTITTNIATASSTLTTELSTATPSNSPTFTESPTYTATPDPSSTPTRRLNTATSTTTNTHTLTPTKTKTKTATSSATLSPTNTATNTATQKPSLTPTPTPTATITPFPTLTVTPYLLPATRTNCVPKSDWKPYVVQPGDILFEIALASGLRTDTLRQANCIEGSHIIAGQTILVPPNSPLLQTQNTPIPSAPNCKNPLIQITYPLNGDSLSAPFAVRGIADNEYFGYYHLQISPNPQTVFTIYESNRRIPTNDVLGTVNVPEFPSGNYVLRLIVFNQWGNAVDYCEVQIIFNS
ncbi:MAG: hypothetical protein CUN55_04195 [Phototrophicales bacterium]|nr:MAG: hypothetical protein CUN55_04195 [Phototrophicales bacterium]